MDAQSPGSTPGPGADEKEKYENIYTSNGSFNGGNWVPSTVIGQSGGQHSGAQALIDMLTVKTAKDLSLDMSIAKK